LLAAWEVHLSKFAPYVCKDEVAVGNFLKNFIRIRTNSKEIRAALARGEKYYNGKRIIHSSTLRNPTDASPESGDPYIQKCPRACITAVRYDDPMLFAEEWNEKKDGLAPWSEPAEPKATTAMTPADVVQRILDLIKKLTAHMTTKEKKKVYDLLRAELDADPWDRVPSAAGVKS